MKFNGLLPKGYTYLYHKGKYFVKFSEQRVYKLYIYIQYILYQNNLQYSGETGDNYPVKTIYYSFL